MSKHKFINVLENGETWLLVAKHVRVAEAPRPKETRCEHCSQVGLTFLLEYIQAGMFWDIHTVVLFCQICEKATVVEYKLE